MEQLLTKIKNKTARIGIIGLGYTGLPLAIAFARKFDVVGYDIKEKTINHLLSGRSHILDVGDGELKRYLNTSFYPTTDPEELGKCDFIVICVPTPLTEEKEPNLSYIKNACVTIAKILRKGQFVILESTTYPGTTEEVVVPILETTGLKVVEDFGVAYSPERIDPGNKKYTVEKIPKVVGGIDKECTEIAAMLYGCIIEEVFEVNDARTAEAVKMVENIFRNVNIALVNELSLIFEKMGIDTWDVVNAASTKPYGFMAFYPGPGVGGHCIPLDPFYMSYVAKRYGFIPRFIETSGEINEFMRIHAVNLVEGGLGEVGKKIAGAKVAVMGLAYKKNIDDTRESPSIKIIEELVNRGADVRVYDPYVKSIETKVGEFYSEESIEGVLKEVDCAVFVVDHGVFRALGMGRIKELAGSLVVVDCKNLFEGDGSGVYLGIGRGRLE
ncbi:MAG: nucleotide sugar dehydrogenase [Candidatus Thermoplasmatota archaeon]|nr:nucleotide sugar dehydrogenase [Candidatus Thermoplasmatota archaeon]